MKLLITGGAGFIGSAVIRHIIDNTNHSVVNVDKLTYAGNLESLVSVENDARYAFEQVDICDANEIKRVFNKHQPDIVMHLAAESHVDRSIDGPDEYNIAKLMFSYQLLVSVIGAFLQIDTYDQPGVEQGKLNLVGALAS